MANKIEIYKTSTGTEIGVKLEEDTIWLTQAQMAELFDKDVRTINEHIQTIYKTEELALDPTIRKFRIVRQEGNRQVNRNIDHYNLDMIISVGYRVNSKRGVQFRQWATQRLKDYLVQGYAVNEKDRKVFQLFSHGLALLDDYDHEELDIKGKTRQKAIYPDYNDYMNLIENMYSDFKSNVFARPKDESFTSSIGQIRQRFDGKELYPTIEEKAANLLYFITKNHSFVDGNKRIAAACFLFFLEQNNALTKKDGSLLIDNNTLAAVTLFIATSKPDEADIVKRLVISILNRNKQ